MFLRLFGFTIPLFACFSSYAAQAQFPSVDVEKTYWMGWSHLEDVLVSPTGDVTMLGGTLRLTTIDPAGNLLKDVQAGYPAGGSTTRLAPDGAIFATKGDTTNGTLIAKYLPDQSLAWITNFPAYVVHDFLPTEDGGTLALVDSAVVDRQRLLRIDKDGALLQSIDIPNARADSSARLETWDIRAVPGGGYVIAGTASNGEIRVIRLAEDLTAEVIWAKFFGGSGYDQFVQIIDVPGGGFVIGATSTSGVSGTKTTPARGGEDLWIFELTDSGTIKSQASFGGAGRDVLTAITRTSSAYAVLALSNSATNGTDKTSPPVLDSIGLDEWLLLLDDGFNHLADQTYGRENSPTGRHAFLIANADGTLLRLSYPHVPNIRRYRLDPISVIERTPPHGGVLVGKAVELKSAEDGVPGTSFQWTKDGQQMPGATNSSFAIRSFTTNDAGTYALTVSNPWGIAISEATTLWTADVAYRLELVPSLVIEGTVGERYRVESRARLEPDDWDVEAEFILTNSPQRWLDLSGEGADQRFYHAQKAP